MTRIGKLYVIALACLAATLLRAQDDAFPVGDEMSWHDARMVMAQHCFDCHGGFLSEGGVDLYAQHFERSVGENPELWENVIQALRIHYMPPIEERAMPIERREALIRAIEARLLSASKQTQPAHTTLRRLNRNEFASTLDDLLLIKFPSKKRLPSDDSGYGFDNNADVLSVSPLLLEKYLTVAAEAADWAAPIPMKPRKWIYAGTEFKGKGGPEGNGRVIVAEGKSNSLKLTVQLPSAGAYTARLFLKGDQAGDELVRAKVFINQDDPVEYEVKADKQDEPQAFEWPFKLNAPGGYTVRVELANDYYQDGAPPPNDRNVYVMRLEIEGPVQDAESLFTPFMERHFGAVPEQLKPDAIRAGIQRFASRAYRRPVSQDELNTLWRIYQNENKRTGEPRRALHAVIDAVLASPNFIFRWEPRQSTEEYALASWLSYFIWGTMPDDRLFELARKGELRKNLEPEIHRMLKDSRAWALTSNFAAQWLLFRDIWTLQVDRKTYPAYNEELREAMWQETTRFFNDLFRNDRSIIRVLDADYTYANQRLAQHYGLKEKPEKYQRVSLEGTNRRGVWSQAGVLAVTSHPDRTSPVLRGKFILENLLGMAPPPPPANIPSLSTKGDQATPADFRESLLQHREDPNCASCHNILDPLGLAMEHYDGIGALRRGETPPTEILFDGVVIKNSEDLTTYLVDTRQSEFIATFTENLVTYANGRGIDWRDRAALESITEEAAEHDYKVSAFIYAIARLYAPGMPPVVSATSP